jgi:hypothetical protein
VEGNMAQAPDIQISPEELYKEETFTDRQVGTIQRLTPIDAEGNPDQSRPVLFVGQTQVLTPAGALPISFEIEATNLAEAAVAFGPAAQVGLEDTMRRLEDMRREQASSIIVPETGASPMGSGRGPLKLP